MTVLNNQHVRLLNRGPPVASTMTTTADILQEWGNEWMWEDLWNEGRDLRWVVASVLEGTSIWVTDGSYNHQLAPHVCGAGWLINCAQCGKKLYGSF